MLYKHISFDLWGTIIRSNPEYRPNCYNLIREIFGNITDGTIAAAKLDIDLLMRTTGYQPRTDHIIHRMIGSLSMKVVDFERCLDQFNTKNKQLFFKYPPIVIDDARDVIQKVHGKALLYILSNTTFTPGEWNRQHLQEEGLLQLFNRTHFSNESMFCKPNALFYRNLTHASNGQPVLHVGDDPFTDCGFGAVDSFIISDDNPITNVLKFI